MTEQIELEIIEVINPWSFLACEKSHSSKSGAVHQFEKFQHELNQYCSEFSQHGAGVSKPCVGQICAASSRNDGLWHRVRVDSLISQHHGQQACCYMVDAGSELTVPITRLMKLPEKFRNFPHQVYQCCLWGVHPVSLGTVLTDSGLVNKPGLCYKWDEAATKFMDRMIGAGRECKAEIVEKDSADTHFLRLYVNMKQGTLCLNDALIEGKYAVKVGRPDIRWKCKHSHEHARCQSTDQNNSASFNESCSSELDDMPSLIYENNEVQLDSFSHVSKHNVNSRTCAQSGVSEQFSDESSVPLTLNKRDLNVQSHHRKTCKTLSDSESVSNTESRNTGARFLQDISCSSTGEGDTCLTLDHRKCLNEMASDLRDSSERQSSQGADAFVRFIIGRGRGIISAKKDDIASQNQPFGLQDKDVQMCTVSGGASSAVPSSCTSYAVPSLLSVARSISTPSPISRAHPSDVPSTATSLVPTTSSVAHSPCGSSHPIGFQQQISKSTNPQQGLNSDTPQLGSRLNSPQQHSVPSTPQHVIKPSTPHNVEPHHGIKSYTSQDINQNTPQESCKLSAPQLDKQNTPQPSFKQNTPQLDKQNTSQLGKKNTPQQINMLQHSCKMNTPQQDIKQNSSQPNFKLNASHQTSACGARSQKGSSPHNSSIQFEDEAAAGITRFLEKVGPENGLNSEYYHNVPCITRQDQPIPQPIFGVVVHGKSVPSLACDVDDVHFRDHVKMVMKKEYGIETAKSNQAWVWPAALACRHVIGVSPPNHGKTMSYVPSIISNLLDRTSYGELPPGKGPVALVIVPSWRKARNVFEIVEAFSRARSQNLYQPVTSLNQIRPLVLYAGGTEDTGHTEISLMEGCDILISTPDSLLRMVDKEIVSFKRLCHIILDDAEVLATEFNDKIDTIMQLYKQQLRDRRDQRKCQGVPRQIMIFASQWNEGLDMFRLRYTKEPIIAISSRVEAAVYGDVRQTVTMTKWEKRLTVFCGFLDTLAGSKHRVVVFTQDTGDALEMYKAAKSRVVYCLLIHENLQTEDIALVRKQWLLSSKSQQLVVMVCTDQCYQDLAIMNATMVVHYGLPDSKTKFGNRLACMCDFFLDRTSQLKPQVTPISHILLTDKCAAYAEDLYDILQRCKADYPLQFSRFIEGYRKSKENDERKALCPFLKSFGFCRHVKCVFRHLVIPKQDLKTGEVTENTLPVSGEVKVRVIHVVSASRLYCHLIEHRSVPDDVRTDLRLEYQTLILKMSLYFSNEGNHVCHVPSEDPFFDGLCAFKDDNSTFHRVKVLEVKEASKTTAAQFKVLLVDVGCRKTAAMDQLLKLPDDLSQVPYQAVEVYLCSVKPMDHDKEWTDKASIFLHELIDGKELIGRIVLRAGLSMWLGPLVHQVSVKSVGPVNDINIRHELLEKKLAAPNPNHIPKLYEMYRGKTEIPETLMRQYFDYALEMEMSQETLPENEFCAVNIAAVVSPGLFYLQKWDSFELLEKLQARMAEMMQELKSKGGEHTTDTSGDRHATDKNFELQCGSVCLALSSDGSWYRGKILSDLSDGQWKVFFLDYGDTETVSKGNTRPLPRELAELPCQAVECQLAYIQSTAEDWDHAAVDVICDLAYFVNGEKKQLQVKVVDRLEAENVIGQKLVVDVYDTNAGSVRFSQELVHRHLASSCLEESDGIKVLLGKPALKDQKFFNQLDKIPYLCANIYWSKDIMEAVQQADELRFLLSCRDDEWDSKLIQRDVLKPLFQVVGYIQACEAHGTLLHSLVSCCMDSARILDMALTEQLPNKLMYCLEQVSRPSIQLQAAQSLAHLVQQESFCDWVSSESSDSSSSLVRVVGQFLMHYQVSPKTFELLQFLCCAATKLVQATDDIVSAELRSTEMIEHILCVLQQTSDPEKVPLLELLAAIATWESTHTCLMRESHMNTILALLVQCHCEKCQYYLLTVCQSLVQGSRRHKRILLEARLLILLNKLLDAGLRSPSLEVCKDLQAELTLTFPKPEDLAGVPAHDSEVHKIVCPAVVWSQNCFRIKLNVKVRNADVSDFFVSDSRIRCYCIHDGVKYSLDWELYDSIISHKIVTHASYSLLFLSKQKKGKWSRLLKQKEKVQNLSLDFDHPYDSEDEDVEDTEDLTQLTRQRNLLHEDTVWEVKMQNPLQPQPAEESDDELAFYSHSSDSEPTFNHDFLFLSKLS